MAAVAVSYYEIEPARAKSKDPEKLWGQEAWALEEKFDGWRYLIHFGRELPRVYMTGRRVSVETGFLSEKGEQVPQLWPSAKARELHAYTVIDGEVMPPVGASFGDIAGLMNADIDSARRRIEEIGPPRYVAFDLLYVDGVDVRGETFLQRRELLQRVIERIEHPLINCALQLPALEEHYEKIVARGGEGVVLKDLSAPYGEGWVKVKKYSTIEAIVTGFKEAKFGRTGQFYGMIGSLIVSVLSSTGELLEVGQASGMTVDLRKEISDNRDAWIGKVVEIRAQEWARDRLRHPRFVRERPDVDRQTCTFAKMMRDLGRGEKQCHEEVDPRQLKLI